MGYIAPKLSRFCEWNKTEILDKKKSGLWGIQFSLKSYDTQQWIL